MRVRDVKENAYQYLVDKLYWYNYSYMRLDDAVKDGDADKDWNIAYLTFQSYYQIGLLTDKDFNKAKEEAREKVKRLAESLKK